MSCSICSFCPAQTLIFFKCTAHVACGLSVPIAVGFRVLFVASCASRSLSVSLSLTTLPRQPPHALARVRAKREPKGYVVCPSDKRFLLLFTFLKKNRKKKIMVRRKRV